jgi:glycosyltransferase involved in cell wall biosynthesis
MQKVAIDSGPIRGGNSKYGGGTYVRELTKHLKDVDVIDFSANKQLLNSGKYDILHFTRFRPFFVSLPLTKPKNTKYVLTIYDLIPLIYPKHYPPGVKGWIRWQTNKHLIKKNVDAIITISETSKKDICRFLEVDPKKVFVTHLAAPDIYKPISDKGELTEIKKKYNLPDRFVLSDTEIYYSKNVPNLIKASKIAKIPLVIIGKSAKEIRDVDQKNLSHPELRHLRNIDWDSVITLASVPIEELAKIYNLATVYIQPSFYEGFGLPLIQAIACKIPVVATKTQCLVEILGDEFDYVDANDPKSMAEGILHPNKDKKLPREYSWEITAKKTSEVYKNV